MWVEVNLHKAVKASCSSVKRFSRFSKSDIFNFFHRFFPGYDDRMVSGVCKPHLHPAGRGPEPTYPNLVLGHFKRLLSFINSGWIGDIIAAFALVLTTIILLFLPALM